MRKYMVDTANQNSNSQLSRSKGVNIVEISDSEMKAIINRSKSAISGFSSNVTDSMGMAKTARENFLRARYGY